MWNNKKPLVDKNMAKKNADKLEEFCGERDSRNFLSPGNSYEFARQKLD